MIAFALLSVSLLAVRRRLELSVLQVVLLIALLALASEATQLHLPARTAQLSDLGIDAFGLCAGMLLWRLGRAGARSRRLTRVLVAWRSRRAVWSRGTLDEEGSWTERRS